MPALVLAKVKISDAEAYKEYAAVPVRRCRPSVAGSLFGGQRRKCWKARMTVCAPWSLNSPISKPHGRGTSRSNIPRRADFEPPRRRRDILFVRDLTPETQPSPGVGAR